MRVHLSIRSFVLVASTCLILLVAAPALADDWTFRALGQWNTLSDEVLTNADEGPGVYLGVERRLSDRWGVELGVGWNQIEGSETSRFEIFGIRLESRLETEMEWLPVSVGGHFHLTPESGFDLYVAGRAGWAFFRDVKLRTDFTISDPDDLASDLVIFPGPQTLDFAADDAFFYGLRLGFDRPFGASSWALSATVDYTVLELEYDPQSAIPPPFVDPIPTVSLDLDPVTLGVGVSRRW